MPKQLLETLTLRSYNISSKRRVMFAAELLLFFALVFLPRMVPVLRDLPLLRDIIWIVAVYVGARVILGAIRIALVSAYRARMRLTHESRDNFILGINALVSVLSFVAAMVGVFIVFEIEVQRVLTSLALFSVAIVWIGAEYIRNFIDSFILMFSRDFKLGEYIRIEQGARGVIQDITFRSTKVKTDEGDIFFVPNSKLLNSEVINYSKASLRRITVPFSMYRNRFIGVEVFEAAVQRELHAAFPELVVSEESVYLRVTDIKSDEVQLALEVAVTSYSFAIEDKVRKWFSTYLLDQDAKELL